MFETAYRILADLLVLVHLAFIVFVVCGGWLALRWRWLAWPHIPTAIWGVAIEFRGWICPLTPLENWLRRAGGGAVYSGGFIEHYILPIVYPSGLTRTVQLLLGGGVVAINLLAYSFFLYSRPER